MQRAANADDSSAGARKMPCCPGAHKSKMDLRIVASLLGIALIGLPASAADERGAVERLLDRIVQQEQQFIERLKSRSPLLETYIQETGSSAAAAGKSPRDHYFLGRLGLEKGVAYLPLAARSDQKSSKVPFLRSRASVFVPSGFTQMVFADYEGLSRKSYQFEYIRREFLGEVR